MQYTKWIHSVTDVKSTLVVAHSQPDLRTVRANTLLDEPSVGVNFSSAFGIAAVAQWNYLPSPNSQYGNPTRL